MPRYLLALFLIVLALPAQAFDPAPLVERFGLKEARLGILVETLDGTTLYARDADEPMPPGSTIKLLTAQAVLERLGPDHRFRTGIALAGEDLVLYGTGDPELDIDDLMRLATALRATGRRAIEGRFILDDSALPRLQQITPDQPVEAGYNAGIGALQLAFNRVQVLPPDSVTLPPLVERTPAWGAALAASPAQETTVPVQDTGMHAAHTLRHLAGLLGIALPAPERGVMPKDARVLMEVESKPLAGLVQDMLLWSNNQIAETLGLAASGEATLEDSARALSAAVVADLPAALREGLVTHNHSGLDPAARATPRQLGALLRRAEARHGIMAMLPASGWSGSLARRLRTGATALRLWAKTGSLDYASTLAGFILRPGREPLLIVVMIADLPAREAQDRALEITPQMQAAADDWTRRARDLRDAIAAGFIEG